MSKSADKKRKFAQITKPSEQEEEKESKMRLVSPVEELEEGIGISKEEEKLRENPDHCDKVQSLQSILNFDFSFISADQERIKEKFMEIAHSILNQSVLVVNQTNLYRIAEIELYLNDQLHHKDYFSDMDACSNGPLKWHFLRQNGKSYKAGTYKSLNFTFGMKDKVVGAALIRSLVSLNYENPGQFTEGPCNSVKEIFRVSNSLSTTPINEVKDFVILPDFSWDLFDQSSLLYLRKKEKSDQTSFNSEYFSDKKIWQSPRVGLTLKRFDNDLQNYWLAEYRYLTFPQLQKKYALFIVLSMLKRQYTTSAISSLTTLRKSSIDQISKVFQTSLKTPKHKKFEDFKKHSGKMTSDVWTQAFAFHCKHNP